jgi:putative component of membrane protein insertase Oxa1/YidC/SpoIIIJ protein YidD
MMFAFLFKKAIEVYWLTVPESSRKVCLYRRSCSKEVYAHLNDYGFCRGMRTYLSRRASCRSGYKVIKKEGNFMLLTRKGLYIEENLINPILLSEIKSGTAQNHGKEETHPDW